MECCLFHGLSMLFYQLCLQICGRWCAKGLRPSWVSITRLLIQLRSPMTMENPSNGLMKFGDGMGWWLLLTNIAIRQDRAVAATKCCRSILVLSGGSPCDWTAKTHFPDPWIYGGCQATASEVRKMGLCWTGSGWGIQVTPRTSQV